MQGVHVYEEEQKEVPTPISRKQKSYSFVQSSFEGKRMYCPGLHACVFVEHFKRLPNEARPPALLDAGQFLVRVESSTEARHGAEAVQSLAVCGRDGSRAIASR
jgi:hypothetical protein